jgi:methylamine--corrinoid protein Co-methyltransferase
MEARIGAETGHLVARQGITRKQADGIVEQILAEYESQIPTAPEGKRLDECYNLQTVQPAQEYLDIYEKCKKKLGDFGLDYSIL